MTARPVCIRHRGEASLGHLQVRYCACPACSALLSASCMLCGVESVAPELGHPPKCYCLDCFSRWGKRDREATPVGSLCDACAPHGCEGAFARCPAGADGRWTLQRCLTRGCHAPPMYQVDRPGLIDPDLANARFEVIDFVRAGAPGCSPVERRRLAFRATLALCEEHAPQPIGAWDRVRLKVEGREGLVRAVVDSFGGRAVRWDGARKSESVHVAVLEFVAHTAWRVERHTRAGWVRSFVGEEPTARRELARLARGARSTYRLVDAAGDVVSTAAAATTRASGG